MSSWSPASSGHPDGPALQCPHSQSSYSPSLTILLKKKSSFLTQEDKSKTTDRNFLILPLRNSPTFLYLHRSSLSSLSHTKCPQINGIMVLNCSCLLRDGTLAYLPNLLHSDLPFLILTLIPNMFPIKKKVKTNTTPYLISCVS